MAATQAALERPEPAVEEFETIVVGGGQAGLSLGYYLKQLGQRFVILDANARIGGSWRTRTWDSLRLFTPSRYNGLPGWAFPTPGWSFPTARETADYLEAYAERFELPVRSGWKVDRLAAADGAVRRRVRPASSHGRCGRRRDRVLRDAEGARLRRRARPSDRPDALQRVPPPGTAAARRHPARGCRQLWSRHRDGGLAGSPDVAVGAGQGQIPVRIGTRGHRLVMPLLWFLATRMLTVRTPIGRKLRPHVLEGGAPRIRVKSDDLKAASVELVPRTVGVRDGLPLLEDGRVLDVENVIWCTGFRHDFDWIDAPVLDTANEPVHEGGVAVAPGLNFLGLDFQYSFASENVGGVRYDAKRIAQQSRGARLGGLSFREGFPIFHTADLERAVRFYVELIGCEEVFRYEDAYVGLTGPVTLGLTAVQELEPAGRVTLWLYCDDADAEIERLRAAGVEVAREPEDREWGERAGSVRDPDRNEVWIAAQ
jgi:putative flavoprotein involved in K+ transport